MNELEATQILKQQLDSYRVCTQPALLRLLDDVDDFACTSPSGTIYHVEVQAFWDDESKQELRISGCIDDGGRRAWRPLCDDFIMRANGSFVGEE